MCGIIGALSFGTSDFRVTPDYLLPLRDSMAHRGPDGAGLWISSDGRAGLAHRRLSIVDLSDAAGQPMCNEAGDLWLVFNGEIYNHAEVRRELKSIGGHVWKTDHSDSEVILHAFEQWGIDCLERFRGMFAFALYDLRQRCLWLVRDRIGIKPLYYSVHHDRLVFASEIKAILTDPTVPREVNENALYHYLSFLTTPAPDTLFAGIRKLPASTWLRIDSTGHVTQRRYWNVWERTTPMPHISEAEAAEAILAELRTAVKLRKVSDVPVGVFLSGGIDSSTNAVLFSEEEAAPVRTFSIGFEGDYKSCPSELQYARRIAQQVGADHYEYLLSQQDVLDFVPQMVTLQDEPIADPVCVPVYYVAKLAREHGVPVCQVGEGADELFCGYPRWKAYLQLQDANHAFGFPAAHKLGLAALNAFGSGESMQYELLRRASIGQPVFWSGAEAFTEAEKRRLLSPRMRTQCAGVTSWDALRPDWEDFQQSAWDKSPLHWMTYADLRLRLPELLLMRVDKMSMAVSLEGRVPFLDHKFVELALSLPASLKTRNRELKHILKKAVTGLLPHDIIHRRKQGFAIPLREWFAASIGQYCERELSAFCRETDFFDAAEVQRYVRERRHKQVWYLLNFALWWKQYIAQAPVSHEAVSAPTLANV